MLDGLDKHAPYIRTVDNVFSSGECHALIEAAEIREQWHAATINTFRGPRLNTFYRNNDRVMFDDVDFAQMLYLRLSDAIPKTIHGYTCCGINERMRVQRYRKGMHFAPHHDASFARSDVERSYYTVLIYLNDDFEGGQTAFVTNPPICIEPKRGMVLIFQHPIVHEGCPVIEGMKYVVRTDVMYMAHASLDR